jgi:hypothetical protein
MRSKEELNAKYEELDLLFDNVMEKVSETEPASHDNYMLLQKAASIVKAKATINWVLGWEDEI